MKRSRVLIAVIFGLLITAPQTALASRFYFEMAAGLAQIRSSATFFATDAPNPLSFGIALSAALMGKVTPLDSPIGLHLGLQHRYSTGLDDYYVYTVQATYPVVRIEAKRVYFTLGATPFVWKRIAETAGIDGIARADAWYGGLLEVGYTVPITPQALFAVTASAEEYFKGGTLSPNPVLGLSAVLRFAIGKYNSSRGGPDSARDLDPYDGWRYPRGYPR